MSNNKKCKNNKEKNALRKLKRDAMYEKKIIYTKLNLETRWNSFTGTEVQQRQYVIRKVE